MRKSRSDYAIIAAICAAAHSTTCSRPFNVLKFLGHWLSCFRVLTDGLVPSALRGVQHFSFARALCRTCCIHQAGTCPLVSGGPKNWYGLESAEGGLPSSNCAWFRLYVAGFNLTVESECVFKTSSNWVLHLSSCI